MKKLLVTLSIAAAVVTGACASMGPPPIPEVKTNLLTSGSSDPDTRCPEYKVTAVRATRVDGVHRAPREAAAGFRQDAHD